MLATLLEWVRVTMLLRLVPQWLATGVREGEGIENDSPWLIKPRMLPRVRGNQGSYGIDILSAITSIPMGQ